MIALYGATGYTGKLVAAELRARGLPFVLGGRDPEKLRRLSERMDDAPWRAASSEDAGSLAILLDGAEVLINCAGPFRSIGDPVVSTAVASGTHYLDSTGEQDFLHRTLTTQDAPAREAGVAVVPAMGFDFVPGDCIAALTAKGLGPLHSMTISYDVKNWAMGSGSMHTAIEILRSGRGLRRKEDETVPARRMRSRRIDYDAAAGSAASVFYPSGEVVTVPRHVDVANLDCYMSVRSLAPPAAAPIFPLIRPLLAAGTKTPLRRVLHAAVRRLPDGPELEARRAAQFTIVAEAHAESGVTRRGVVSGFDTYGSTATILAWSAERMSRADYRPTGALAPSQAFEPEELLGAITDHGVGWKTDPLGR